MRIGGALSVKEFWESCSGLMPTEWGFVVLTVVCKEGMGSEDCLSMVRGAGGLGAGDGGCFRGEVGGDRVLRTGDGIFFIRTDFWVKVVSATLDSGVTGREELAMDDVENWV